MTNTTVRRPIDVHEDAILTVLDECENGSSYVDALVYVSYLWELSTDRLGQLVRTWCAIAGVQVPA